MSPALPLDRIPGRTWALGLACQGIGVAGGFGSLGSIAVWLAGGPTSQLLAGLVGLLSASFHLMTLPGIRRGQRWPERALPYTTFGALTVLAVVESEPGTWLYLCFGCPYFAMLGYLVSVRPWLWRTIAAMLFPALLLLRHALRPMSSLQDPLDLAFICVTGTLVVWGLSSWTVGLMHEIGAALDGSVRAELALQHVNRELALARDEALTASRTKDRFLANMSHELRTPLNAILGYVELLLEEEQSAQSSTDLRAIRSASTHLLALVSSVLDLARVESGVLTPQRLDLPLASFVAEVADTARPLVAARGNKLVVLSSLQVPTFHTDPVMLRQVLLNLLGNAAKFTEEGTITLSVCSSEAELLVEVHDTGIGIPPDRLESVFERFSQVDSSSTRLHGGAGLGLSLGRGLVELLGGKIALESELGVGSTFRVHLPSARELARA
jgi:signal transduction histidine kinase